MNKKLSGIYAALFTPFNKNGEVMYDSLQRHVEYLIKKGIEGFYINGSTGEAFLMRPEERKKALDAVVEVASGKVTLISHCGAIGTDISIDLIKHSAKLPVDAISSVPPFYYGFRKDDIIGYYNDLASASDKPFIVYNIPKFSGVIITPDIMAELRKNPNIQGLKFTHNDFAALEAIRSSDPDLVIYNGFDEMCICGLSVGCNGAIGSTYNIIAPIMLKLRDCCNANDFAAARELQKKANEYIRLLTLNGKHFNISKYIISKIEGIDYGTARRPFSPLKKEEIDAAEKVIEMLKEDGI